MNNKMDAYFLLIVLGVAIGAIALIYYEPFKWKKGMMPTRELCVTQMEFTTLSDSDIIILHVTNPETKPLTVATVKINGYTQNKITGDSIHGLTFEPGDLCTITIEQNWIAGNNYTVDLFTPDGHLLGSYTDTA